MSIASAVSLLLPAIPPSPTALNLTNDNWYESKVVIDDDIGDADLQRLQFWVDTDDDGSYADETTLLDTIAVDDVWSAGHVWLVRGRLSTATQQFDNVKVFVDNDVDGNLIEAFVAADMNCDGAIDSFDVSPFILAMTNPTLYEQTYPNCNHLNGELNGDGAVDSFDLDLFTALLLGSGGAGGLRVEYTWNVESP